MGLFRRRNEPAEDNSAVVEAEVSILRQMLLHYPPGGRPNFGAPTRCPSCGDFGLVNGVDHQRGVCFNECFSCGAQWVVTRRALRALKEALSVTGGVMVHDTSRGDGLLLAMRDGLGTPPLSPTSDDLLVPGAGSSWLAEAERADLAREAVLREPEREQHPQRSMPIALPAGRKLDVLLVEDSELDAELIRAILAPVMPTEIALYHATTSKEGKALFAHRTVDIVLLDLGLPDSRGIDTLKAWKHTGLPIAVVTGDDDLTLASAAKRAGAAEFVPKRRLAHLIDDGAAGTDELTDLIRRAALSRP